MPQMRTIIGRSTALPHPVSLILYGAKRRFALQPTPHGCKRQQRQSARGRRLGDAHQGPESEGLLAHAQAWYGGQEPSASPTAPPKLKAGPAAAPWCSNRVPEESLTPQFLPPPPYLKRPARIVRNGALLTYRAYEKERLNNSKDTSSLGGNNYIICPIFPDKI